MFYSISSGTLYDICGDPIGRGYSGYGLCRNQPNKVSVKNRGPIPPGLYFFQKPFDSDKTGPLTIQLVPLSDNIMYGRDGFSIHGDLLNNPGLGSHGCIIMSHDVRVVLADSLDECLCVFP